MKRKSVFITFILLIIMLISSFTIVYARLVEDDPVCTSHEWRSNGSDEPTCTSSGRNYYKCSKCGETKSEYVGALGHNAGSTWYSDSSSHWKRCTRCNTVLDDTGHNWSGWQSNGSQHWKYCTTCGREAYRANHGWPSTYSKSQEQHWKNCTTCGREGFRANHDFTPEEIAKTGGNTADNPIGRHICQTPGCNYNEVHILNSNHVCMNSVCNYSNPHKNHYYPLGIFSTCAMCDEAALRVNSNVEDLDYKRNYTSWDYNGAQVREDKLDYVSLVFNYPPYVDFGNNLLSMEWQYKPYVHGTIEDHAQHAGTAEVIWRGMKFTVEEDEGSGSVTTYAPDYIKNIENGKGLEELIAPALINETVGAAEINWKREMANGETDIKSIRVNLFIYERDSNLTGYTFIKNNDLTYISDTRGFSGRYVVENIKVGGKSVIVTGEYSKRLFCNEANSKPAATPVYGNVNVKYIDTKGKSIPDAPNKYINNLLVYSGGAKSASYTAKADLSKLDSMGWRYVGYKVYNSLTSSGGVVASGSSTSYTVKPTYEKQHWKVAFIFEPIKLTIEHRTLDGTLIVTQKNTANANEKIDTPKSYSGRTGYHKCALRNCKLSGGVSRHIFESLNKMIWPGYMLEKVTVAASGAGTFTYTYDTNNPDNPNGTTRLLKINEQSDPSNLGKTQKNIAVGSTINLNGDSGLSGEKVGYRKDRVITYYYSSLALNISHIDETTNSFMTATDGTQLNYTKMTNGGIAEPSLSTDRASTMTMNGRTVSYDATRYILSKITIQAKERESQLITITKDDVPDYVYPSFITQYWLSKNSPLNPGQTKTALTQLLTTPSKDMDIKFYYKLAQKLEVIYIDEEGNELIPGTLIAMESGNAILTPPKHINIIPSYIFTGYVLDGGAKVEVDGISNIVVLDNGNDRVIKLIYKQDKTTILNNDKKAILRSNNRDNEEYNVDKGTTYNRKEAGAIPTSEDLYANVIAEAFKMDSIVTIQDKTSPLNLTIVKQYYKSANTDTTGGTGVDLDKDNIYLAVMNAGNIDIDYKYYSAQNAELNIINYSEVFNTSIIDKAANTENRTKIQPNYLKEPSLIYSQGGKIVSLDTQNVPSGYGSLTNEMSGHTAALTPGFYNVVKDPKGVVASATLVLDGFTYVAKGKVVDKDEILKDYKANNNALLTELVKEAAEVNLDKLQVEYSDRVLGKTIYNIISGENIRINRQYTLADLKTMGLVIRDNILPLTDRDVLYKPKGIFIKENAKNINTSNSDNGEYKTTANVYYRLWQKIDKTTGEVITVNSRENNPLAQDLDLPGNDVNVHTPIINETNTILDSDTADTSKNMELIPTVATDTTVLVLGRKFDVKIPHTGTHINADGYKTKVYNYDGGNAEYTETLNAIPKDTFAKQKFIKFEFNVYYKEGDNWTYITKGTWKELPLATETYTFAIPSWDEEIWKDNSLTDYKTRVIAENYMGTTPTTATASNGNNINKTYYIAEKTFKIKVIGEMYDLKVNSTNDPAWTRFKKNEALNVSDLPLGQANQNNSTAYKYAIKLGYKAYFDLKTIGIFGQTIDSIRIAPKYYFIPATGGNAQEVDLYYNTTAKRYVNLADKPITMTTTINNQYARVYNVSLLAEITNAAKQSKAKILLPEIPYNYTKAENIGTSSSMKLGLAQRLPCSNVLEIIQSRIPGATLAVNGAEYSVGHWYGEFRLPASTMTVPKGEEDVGPDTTFLKDGYIVVVFEKLEAYNGETPYLSYYKPNDSSRWTSEGGDNEIELPNGNTGTVPISGAIMLYEGNMRANNDSETAGTH